MRANKTYANILHSIIKNSLEQNQKAMIWKVKLIEIKIFSSPKTCSYHQFQEKNHRKQNQNDKNLTSQLFQSKLYN